MARRTLGRSRWSLANLLLAIVLVAVCCTGSQESEARAAVPGSASNAPTAEDASAVPATTPTPRATRPASPTPASPTPVALTPAPTLGLPDSDAARSLEPAPLGTYAVAREGAGIPRPAGAGQQARLEIPVYETPFGPPRTLLDVNEIDGVSQPVSLTNWADGEGALVLRVIAGGLDDDWLMVQAPSRPNERYVWVRGNDFDLGFTNQRIEIDLAGPGSLTLFDGTTALIETEIVQGRDSRPTPTHLTFIERGVRASSISPAYGTAILAMASFSEVLGTFGGGGMPSNFLHGTNQPDLMGQRVSSGEIRVTNEILDEIIEMIVPGTPVLMFNSALAVADKTAILERTPALASTVGFAEGSPAAMDITASTTPQLWRRCTPASSDAALCRTGPEQNAQGRYAYITARPDAGRFDDEIERNVIDVYDVPDGEPRTLVHQAPDGWQPRVLLQNPTAFGQPLVLWPLEVTPDEQWIRVQAPVRPQRQSVWVRANDFEFGYTDYRIEIDIHGQGNLSFFDGDTELISSLIVSGRASRPTPLGATYIDGVLLGEELSPAYGSYVLSMPIFNEALSTFGGWLAKQSIHGTNQPELMGQRVASGHVRVPNEVLTFMAQQPGGLLGARVVTVDSSGDDRDAAIAREESRPWTTAVTTDPQNQAIPLATPGY